MKTREMKVSKNVTLTMTNIEVITQVMDKSRANFSRALNIILDDWVRMRKTLRNEAEKARLNQEINQISQAKVIRE